MRNIINLSLPRTMVKEVEEEVKEEGFASKSEFFRHILREYKLAKELEADRRKFEKGEGRVLKSLRSLRCSCVISKINFPELIEFGEGLS